MLDKILNCIELHKCSFSSLKKVWKVLYEDYEDCPANREETANLLIDSLNDIETNKIKKIYKILFKDEEE